MKNLLVKICRWTITWQVIIVRISIFRWNIKAKIHSIVIHSRFYDIQSIVEVNLNNENGITKTNVAICYDTRHMWNLIWLFIGWGNEKVSFLESLMTCNKVHFPSSYTSKPENESFLICPQITKCKFITPQYWLP